MRFIQSTTTKKRQWKKKRSNSIPMRNTKADITATQQQKDQKQNNQKMNRNLFATINNAYQRLMASS